MPFVHSHGPHVVPGVSRLGPGQHGRLVYRGGERSSTADFGRGYHIPTVLLEPEGISRWFAAVPALRAGGLAAPEGEAQAPAGEASASGVERPPSKFGSYSRSALLVIVLATPAFAQGLPFGVKAGVPMTVYF